MPSGNFLTKHAEAMENRLGINELGFGGREVMGTDREQHIPA